MTGATGFVGNNLVEKLVEKKYEVVAQGRTVKPWTSDCVKNRLIKINFDKRGLNLGKFDIIVNCLSQISSSTNSWKEFSYSNCFITSSLINNISCRKFIHLSTCSVFSTNSKYHSQPDPNNLYGLSKYVSEKLVQIERGGISKLIILRFPIIIGRNKQNSDFIKYIIERGTKDKDINLFANGLYFRNVVHVSEAVRAIYASITSDDDDINIINIGSSNTLRTIDICKFVLKKINSKSKIKFVDNNNLGTDCDSFVDVSNSSLINYNGLTVQDNLDLFLKEFDF